MRAFALVALLAACEAVPENLPFDAPRDATPDMDPDGPAPTRCDPAAPFGTPALVPGVNSIGNDTSFYIDSARLSGILTREYQPATGGPPVPGLFTTSRATTTSLFADIQPITDINQGGKAARGRLAESGLALYFESDRTPGLSFGVYRAVRPDPAADYTGIMPIFDTGAAEGQPFIGKVTGSLWFFRSNLVHFAPREGNAFGEVIQHNELGAVLSPVVTGDELEIVFRLIADDDIYHATRASTADAFGPPSKLDELSSGSIDEPSDISADGCDIIIVSDRPGGAGGYDIYQASRPRPPGL